ncbi:MAG: hypothetical protein J6B56_02415 [Clostridia bacterium]|nr:hypothetical protein [Clostridia bacterium]
MKINKQNIKILFATILLYCFLLFSSGFYFQSFNGTFSISAMLCCSLILIIMYKPYYEKKFDLTLFFAIGTCFIIGIEGLLLNEAIKQILIVLSGIVIALGLIYALDYKDFKKLYINLMVIIAVGSLFFLGMSYLAPQFVKLFPKLTNGEGSTNYFCVLSMVNFQNMRNYGIFWEPGAFQVFLSLAMLFEIFSDEKCRIWVLVLFAIVMVTTYSSIAVLSLFLLGCLWIFNSKFTLGLKIVSIIAVVAGILLGIIWLSDISPDFKYAFDKIKDFFNPNSTNGSVTVRQDSIFELLKLFFNSPLMGVGFSGIEMKAAELGYDVAATTVIYWFGRYGIFVGAILTIGLYKFTKLLTKNHWLRIFIFGTIICFTMTEHFAFSASFLIFPFYGYKYSFNNSLNIKKLLG